MNNIRQLIKNNIIDKSWDATWSSIDYKTWITVRSVVESEKVFGVWQGISETIGKEWEIVGKKWEAMGKQRMEINRVRS